MPLPRPCLTALTLILFLPLAPAAEPKPETAEKFAGRFYSTLVKVHPNGIPAGAAWTKLRPFFTPDVVAALEKRQKEEEVAAKKHPDEPPIYGDGCIFCSLTEGVEHFVIGKPTAKGETTRVPAALSFGKGKDGAKWTDTLVLVPAGTTWQIHDIELGGQWAYKAGDGLRQQLKLKK